MYHLKVIVIENIRIKKNLHRINISASKITKNCQPGQFVTIDCNKFLRRPFSISNTNKDKLEIIYKVIGEGTQYLAKKKKGDIVDVFGPLGQAYKIPDKNKNSTFILVAGGTGIASLLFLAKRLSNTSKKVIFYGAKTKEEIIDLSDLKNLGWQINIYTEDGSAGDKGFVTDSQSLRVLLRGQALQFCSSKIAVPDPIIYSAGPTPMLKKVIEICKKYKLQAQLSFEQMIACGVGACRGCVIETINGYKTICKDGPVFSTEELINL